MWQKGVKSGRKAIQVNGEALKCDREIKGQWEALKSGDETLRGDPVPLKGDRKGLTGNEEALKSNEEALKGGGKSIGVRRISLKCGGGH